MKIRSSRAWRARVLLLGVSLTIATNAVDAADPHESLTLARAIELASSRSPSVTAFGAETEAATHRNAADALPPNLLLESEFENFAGTGPTSGSKALEATVRITRVFELGDKAALRRGVGAAELERLAADQRTRQLDLAAEVARRFVHVLSDQEMVTTAERATALAKQARDAARQRVTIGASSPAALGRAEIALSRAEIEREHAEHELETSRVKLAVLWGEQAPSFAKVEGQLFELSAQESFDAYQARLESSPDLARFAAQLQTEDARVRLAQAQRKPDVAISAGVRRLEAFDDQALVAGFSVPLGTRRRADYQERAARASRAVIESEREARRLELHATLFDLYQELLHARTEAQSLREKVRPQAEAMLKTTSEGYQAGRFSLLELADAQIQLIELERESIRAAAQFHTLMIDIERVTGEPITVLATRSTP
jgi:cobalt-zinc-cadmium efflux system outer membrane protein